MASPHSLMLLDIAPQIAETFRTDPDVAKLLDPAVFVGVDEDACAAAVVERLQLMEVMSGVDLIERIPMGNNRPEKVPIAVLVMDKTHATMYRVADPRTNPELWPWMGIEDDKD
jgi:hypothetical protein